MLFCNRVMLVLAGLSGAGGVAAAAASAHGSDARLMGAVALVALTHGALLAALGFSGRAGYWQRGVTALTMLGLVFFCGDLALRALYGERLFAMAAPTGGSLLILGWLVLALSGLFDRPGKSCDC
ncbi:MAG: DUF423 domain-containing protein [Hyphomicrobiaceae bacterium]|nr:DUF423 domain-containing protein [Hyphomicrobiaceae bacterium]